MASCGLRKANPAGATLGARKVEDAAYYYVNTRNPHTDLQEGVRVSERGIRNETRVRGSLSTTRPKYHRRFSLSWLTDKRAVVYTEVRRRHLGSSLHVDLFDNMSDRWRTVGLCGSLVKMVLLLVELQAHSPRVDRWTVSRP